ncbi:hypothetical protein [Veillonella sp.]|uniref:hypothetical protein n=1 Tax=Veillonella sp. TaxID=1926307 RepID=UPI0025CDE3DA|nr:hypothetical protein [Veillonella sp.]
MQLITYPKYEVYSASKLLLLRLFVTLLSCMILWTNAEESKSFFNTLVVFSLSQLLYILSIKCNDKIRQIFSWISLAVILGIIFLSVVGLMGVASIVNTDVGFVIAFIKPGKLVPLFGSEGFVITIAFGLMFLYTIEWATGWFAKKSDDVEIQKADTDFAIDEERRD